MTFEMCENSCSKNKKSVKIKLRKGFGHGDFGVNFSDDQKICYINMKSNPTNTVILNPWQPDKNEKKADCQ